MVLLHEHIVFSTVMAFYAFYSIGNARNDSMILCIIVKRIFLLISIIAIGYGTLRSETLQVKLILKR